VEELKYLKCLSVILYHFRLDILSNICISFYLCISSGIKNNDFNLHGLLNCSTNLSQFIVDFYFNSLYHKYLEEDGSMKLSYSQWFNQQENTEFF